MVSWKEERGTLLLISLLVMSSLLITASLISVLILRGLRLSKDTESGMTAFYAAESGIEDSLYELRKADATAADLDNGGGSLSNNTSWRRSVYDKTDYATGRFLFYDILYKNYFIIVDLFDRALLPTYEANVALLRLLWKSGESLEVTWRKYDPDTGKLLPLQPETDSAVCSASPCDILLDNNGAYRLTIEALDNINDLQVLAYSDSGAGQPVNFNLPMTVKSLGSYGEYRQGIEMKLQGFTPWQ